MRFISMLFNWIIGICLLAAGAVVAAQTIIGGLLMVVAGLLILPIVRNACYRKTKWVLSRNIRALLVLGCVIASVSYLTASMKQAEEQELALLEQAREAEAQLVNAERISELKERRDEIVSAARKAFDDGDYKRTIADAEKYAGGKDLELEKLGVKAKAAQKKLDDMALTEKLLSELKTIPAAEYSENLSRYNQLMELYPENEKYQQKASFYLTKVQAEQEEKAVAKARIEKIEQQFSVWSGAHRGLEDLLKKSMHDPSSYEHVETRYGDNGDHIVVLMTYRGKNAFGGLVKNSASAKVTVDGYILEWKPSK